MAKKKPNENIAHQFALLYVHGPEGVRGNWQACEKQLKKTVEVSQEVREAIRAEGGSVENIMPEAPSATITELDLDLGAVFDDTKSEDEWKELAKKLAPVIQGIAQGEIKASAAQTAIIKHVLERAYGRIGQKEQQVVSSGVIILPALGERSEMFVCPNCAFRVEQKHPKKKAENED